MIDLGPDRVPLLVQLGECPLPMSMIADAEDGANAVNLLFRRGLISSQQTDAVRRKLAADLDLAIREAPPVERRKPKVRRVAVRKPPKLPENLKQDPRPTRLGWRPGTHLRRCSTCDGSFTGHLRAVMCAPCAYGGDSK